MRNWLQRAGLVIVAVGVVTATHRARAGNIRSSAVGGVSINTEGVLSNPTVEALEELRTARAKALDPIEGDLQTKVSLRKLSLKRLDAAIRKHRATEVTPLPDSIQYLGGLQRVQYVFVYPDDGSGGGDVVLAGPAEGWKIDPLGNVVGKTTGQPVLLLEDLLAALRTTKAARGGELTCSIDPTSEGLQNLRQLASKLRTIGNPQQTARRIEEALGPQVISVGGVPASSHFARVMVAADYRMKRLAMHLDPSPVAGLPSFMQLVKGEGRGLSNMLPRWWLAPQADPLRTSPDGLSWELRNIGVACHTEQDFLAAGGQRQQTGKADAVAKRWADTFTEQYAALSKKDSVFAQLRNVMELAVVAALVDKESMLDKAGLALPQLMGEEPLETYDAPKKVSSQASLMKKGRNWVISASGGVKMNPWKIAGRSESASDMTSVRDASTASGDRWWWN